MEQAQEKLPPGVLFRAILAAAWRIHRELRVKGGRVNKHTIVRFIGILLCICSFNLLARTSGASVRVGGESLRANGQVIQGHQYMGPCPVDLQFGWGVIGTEPTTMNYHFVRSDGGHSAGSQSVSVPQTNRSVPVYERWRLGANTAQFANYSGWVKLIIDSPNQVEGKIAFTIHCQ
ncbi:MAG TPA: hypothetical protein VGE83_11415 [Terracidiphilus sp.]